jgi:hypothetical protein
MSALSRRVAATLVAPLAVAGLLALGTGTASAAPAAPAAASCTNGFGNPNTCAQAVAWAKAHITTTYHSDYYERCDHVVGLEYGFPASGSVSAESHWNAMPAADKHAGVTTVPAGGLAFFSSSSGFGHVMISIGSGEFISTDIGGNGTLTKTTIATIKSKWGETYLGWGEPWFQYNH